MQVQSQKKLAGSNSRAKNSIWWAVQLCAAKVRSCYISIIHFLQDEDGMPLVTKIRDSAGQKGTGKWTAISALDHGMPVTLIAESVFAR